MNDLLEEKFLYLSNFFNEALAFEDSKIANSIIFYGRNLLAQYYFALNIAKILNCTECKLQSCSCINCNWLRQNKHPAVLTISKLDNKFDSSKTVISKEQIDMVKDGLVNSSEYHRVFIFCDAKFEKLSEAELKGLEEYKDVDFALPQKEENGVGWYPKGLTRACFQDVSANALLKLIEEPPSNVTFIFLTEDKNDLIPTIVSRSQAFYVPGIFDEEYKVDFLMDLFKYYPEFSVNDAVDFSNYLYDYQHKNDLNPYYILDCIQFYLSEILKRNLNNKKLTKKIYRDIAKIQTSKKMLDSYVKEQTVYEDLAFYLSD